MPVYRRSGDRLCDHPQQASKSKIESKAVTAVAVAALGGVWSARSRVPAGRLTLRYVVSYETSTTRGTASPSLDRVMLARMGVYSSRVQQPWSMQGDAGGRTGTSDLLKQLIRMHLPVATDHMVMGAAHLRVTN
jgi:hypothetical protein